MNLRRLLSPLAIIILFLASCNGILIPVPAATETPQVLPTPTIDLLGTPTIQPSDLTICSGSEPTDLFLYNELTPIKKVIFSALYDGPIDEANYSYQPVILEKISSMLQGDAVIGPVKVTEGSLVVDNEGVLVALAPGVFVRPVGCTSDACAVTYEGGDFEMDQMQVAFHIRPGVQWTDGADVTAEDSVFAYELAVSPEILYGNNGLVSGSALSVSLTDSYVAVDELTTRWVGRPGFIDPNYQLNFFHPLPKHQLGDYPIDQLLEANEVLFSPLGWGAYMVTSWATGEQLTLEPNPNYYRRLEGLPYIPLITIRFVGQDIDRNLAALEDGECDILMPDAIPGVPTETMVHLANDGIGMAYPDPVTVSGDTFEYLLFNISPADETLFTYFSNQTVRLAVDMCLDRAALTNLVYGGLTAPLEFALPLDHPLMEGAPLQVTQFNVDAAGSLLDSSGWRDEDGDGVREAHGVPGYADGQPMDIQLVSPDDNLRLTLSELVATQLRTCGVNVTFHQAPSRELLAQNADALLSGRHFDLALLSAPMTVEGLCAMATTSQISGEANGWSGTNLGGYSNAMFDAACEQVNSSLPSLEEYTTSRQTALLIFSQSELIVPLFRYTGFSLAGPALSGLENGWQAIESFRIGP